MLSVRRATAIAFYTGMRKGISIHALREESDDMTYKQYKIKEISIHALREESDSKTFGGRTIVCISIHALREESDNIRKLNHTRL